jgi:hypothetical protein
MKLVPISAEAIPLGHPLPYALHSEDGSLLASKGFVIESRPELDLLREKRTLYIEPISRANVARLSAMLNQDTTLGEIAESTLAEPERVRAPVARAEPPPTWESMQQRANWVLRDTGSHEALMRLNHLHHDLVRLVRHNADASLLALIHLSATDTDLYSATHALLVATMCLLAARDNAGLEGRRPATSSPR